MTAKEARAISEGDGKSLRMLLNSIKASAEVGCLTATWSRLSRVISDQDIIALKDLGYIIMIDDGTYVKVGW